MNCFNRVINVYLSQGMIENITIQSDKQNKINTVNFKKQQPYKTWCLLVNKRYEFFDHLDSRWFTDLILKNTVLWSKRNFVLPVLLPRAMKASLSTVESYLLWFNLILKKKSLPKTSYKQLQPCKNDWQVTRQQSKENRRTPWFISLPILLYLAEQRPECRPRNIFGQTICISSYLDCLLRM